ncbi:Nmad3 domain-containing protein [Sulfidibacter corallicola]|uniref:Nucleotide modification associated domain-containing protein n=1 Tax=Sulfidibacter corallicola TaxID=2818388 RepID=A0A8A4TWI6_SULCO|nr:hypothetical protein [Sulfidibacter corallicola]QTD50885.1 hypothetical protein J3U87_00320 [Sulfidibacter corallicola]
MKLVLSRKGFDSSAGGCANPILPDGSLWPLPIPDEDSPFRYGQLQRNGIGLADLLADLTRGRVAASMGAHLDPDLERDDLTERTDPHWQPTFGQQGAALGHLFKQGISPGDLFLFYGWFREIETTHSGWRFRKSAEDRHILFGWFQIDRWLDMSRTQNRNRWQARHPHAHGTRANPNVLFLAPKRLRLGGERTRFPGAGSFSGITPGQVLTEPGGARGDWLLPSWFHPEGRASVLSYHADPKRWRQAPEGTRLRNVNRGQEFVLDLDHYPEAHDWLHQLFTAAKATPAHDSEKSIPFPCE